MPLMLDPTDEDLIAKWLDPDFTDVEQFASWLEPRVPSAMRVTRIGKPSLWNPSKTLSLLSADTRPADIHLLRKPRWTTSKLPPICLRPLREETWILFDVCAPEFKARQNLNNEFDVKTLIQFSQAVSAIVDDFRYEEIIEVPLTGVSSGNTVTGTLPNGSRLTLAACDVADIENGKIMQLREYVDTAAAAELSAALA